jgi:hypothetical protein
MAKMAQTPEDSNNEYNARDFQTEQRLKDVHTALPVRVLEVFPQTPGPEKQGDHGFGFVHVTLEIDQIDNEDKAIETEPIYNLPYSRIQGGECALVIDPKPGDIGWAVFCERDISKFKRTRQRSLPDSLRMHSQSDGVYLGGILNDPPRLYVQVREDGGVIIECDDQNLTVNCVKAVVSAKERIRCNTPRVDVVNDLYIGGDILPLEESGRTDLVCKCGLKCTDDVVCKAGSRNISLDRHEHSGVEPGGGNSAAPIAAEAYG